MEVVIGNEGHGPLLPGVLEMINQEAEKSMMIPRHMEDLQRQLELGLLALAIRRDRVVGHACLDFLDDCYIEIGGVIVSPCSRKRGIGFQVTQIALEKAILIAEGRDILFLANPNSHRIGVKLGFKDVAKESLGSVIQSLCVDCSEFPGFPDCHCRGMIYSPALL